MTALALLFIFFVVWVIYRAFKFIFRPSIPSVPIPKLPQVEQAYPYERKKYLLTPTEFKFYETLKSICHQRNIEIFAKVRLEDLVYVRPYAIKNWRWRGYIRSRHIDFVLCDKTTVKILCAIELDDWHHKLSEIQKGDELKNKILRDAGLYLIRIEVKETYDLATLAQMIDLSGSGTKVS